MDIPTDIGARIRRVRKRKGIKLVPLAKAVHTTQPNLSQIENNINKPSERTLILLAQELADDFGIPELQEHIKSSGSAEIRIVGRVTAGRPMIEFPESEVEKVYIPVQMKSKFAETFGLIVSGDSMNDIGIRHRDLVILHKTNGIPINGSVVVVRIGSGETSEFTIKRWFKDSSIITLRPENNDYDEIIVDTKRTEIHIEGSYAGLIRFVE